MKHNLLDNELIFENYSKTKKVLREEHTNVAEKKEVQIGNEILEHANSMEINDRDDENQQHLAQIVQLAQDLIDMHTGKAVVQPGTGGALVKPGSVL